MSGIPEQFAPYWQAIFKVREQKFERTELEHRLAESNVIIERLERTNAALLAVAKEVKHRHRDQWGICMCCGADISNGQDHAENCTHEVLKTAIASAEKPE